MKKIVAIAVLSLLMIGHPYAQTAPKKEIMNNKEQKEHYTFQLSDKVSHQAITFKNRYGISIAADLYIPKNRGNERLAALVISGPFDFAPSDSANCRRKGAFPLLF